MGNSTRNEIVEKVDYRLIEAEAPRKLISRIQIASQKRKSKELNSEILGKRRYKNGFRGIEM